jgi:tRNA (mo5U34)-methyltransferase
LEANVKSCFLRNLVCKPEQAEFLKNHIDGQPEWFHSFSFDNGLATRGRDQSHKKLYHLCLPESLSGKTVIDVGAYEGFFSYHCESRGAARVVACDKFVWDWPNSTAFPNFQAVHRAIGSKVEAISSYVEDIPALIDGKFDIVLFLGVLYHAPNMIQYLEAISKITSGVLVLETYVDALDESGPRVSVYDYGEVNNDATNWSGPNLHAIDIMLRRVGFRMIDFVNIWDINTRDAVEGRTPLHNKLKTGRAVLHAYK